MYVPNFLSFVMVMSLLVILELIEPTQNLVLNIFGLTSFLMFTIGLVVVKLVMNLIDPSYSKAPLQPIITDHRFELASHDFA